MCINVLPGVCALCAWCPWSPGEGVRSLGGGVTGGYDLYHEGARNQTPVPGRAGVLLTAEPFPQPPLCPHVLFPGGKDRRTHWSDVSESFQKIVLHPAAQRLRALTFPCVPLRLRLVKRTSTPEDNIGINTANCQCTVTLTSPSPHCSIQVHVLRLQPQPLPV